MSRLKLNEEDTEPDGTVAEEKAEVIRLTPDATAAAGSAFHGRCSAVASCGKNLASRKVAADTQPVVVGEMAEWPKAAVC